MILLLLQFFEKKLHYMDVANNQGSYKIAVGIFDFGDITLLKRIHLNMSQNISSNKIKTLLFDATTKLLLVHLRLMLCVYI